MNTNSSSSASRGVSLRRAQDMLQNSAYVDTKITYAHRQSAAMYDTIGCTILGWVRWSGDPLTAQLAGSTLPTLRMPVIKLEWVCIYLLPLHHYSCILENTLQANCGATSWGFSCPNQGPFHDYRERCDTGLRWNPLTIIRKSDHSRSRKSKWGVLNDMFKILIDQGQ
jgi:hypothetical protein